MGFSIVEGRYIVVAETRRNHRQVYPSVFQHQLGIVERVAQLLQVTELRKTVAHGLLARLRGAMRERNFHHDFPHKTIKPSIVFKVRLELPSRLSLRLLAVPSPWALTNENPKNFHCFIIFRRDGKGERKPLDWIELSAWEKRATSPRSLEAQTFGSLSESRETLENLNSSNFEVGLWFEGSFVLASRNIKTTCVFPTSHSLSLSFLLLKSS